MSLEILLDLSTQITSKCPDQTRWHMQHISTQFPVWWHLQQTRQYAPSFYHGLVIGKQNRATQYLKQKKYFELRVIYPRDASVTLCQAIWDGRNCGWGWKYADKLWYEEKVKRTKALEECKKDPKQLEKSRIHPFFPDLQLQVKSNLSILYYKECQSQKIQKSHHFWSITRSVKIINSMIWFWNDKWKAEALQS